jgi:neurofilament heavy polypeptide
MDKTSLKKALIEAKEIENFATESAKKMIEKEFLPKIEETVKQTLMEMEEKEINEGSEVVINPGAEVEVEVETDGTIKIETDSNSSVEMMTQPDVVDLSADVVTDTIGDSTENVDSEVEDTTETEDDEELFEVVESLNEEEGDGLSVEEKIDSLESKIDKILSLIGSEEKPEGEVEIIDDEETSTEEAPVEDEAPKEEEAPAEEAPKEEKSEEETPAKEETPAEEEELIFEFDDVLDEEKNPDLKEIKDLVKELEDLEIEVNEDFEIDTTSDEETLDLNEILEALSEVEIEEETKDDLLEIEIQENEDEMGESITTSLLNRQSQNKKPETPHKEVRIGLDGTVKAQYESKIDELKKENESLKVALKEYKDSFVVLRKQINEVQTFNAKLAYANKVFTKGGLTNEEKSIISEKFDLCKSAEEAKALYNKLIKENTFDVKQKNVDKIKLPIAASEKSEKGALYESEEVKRMKLLAGIIK